MVGEAERFGAARRVGDDAEDLRDHVAGPLQHHGVADADVLAGDLVLVVQRGAGDDDAADIDRLKPCDRGQRAGAADLDVDLFEQRDGLLGGEFPGDGPAWGAADEAHSALQREVVDFVDDAVDVVVEAGAPGCEVGLEGGGFVFGFEQAGLIVDLEAPLREAVEVFAVAGGRAVAGVAHGVGEQRERTLGRLRRVDLAQRPGGGVARVGVEPQAGRLLGLVEGEEITLGEEDFAADFDQRRGGAFEAGWQRFERAKVCGDVLALGAVAAGGAAHELAVLVKQVDREAVDLRLGHEFERRVGGEAEEAAGAQAPFVEVGGIEGVVEREHRHAVARFGEAARGRSADAAAGAVVADEVGEGGFEFGVAPTQGVVFGVGELGRVMLVIEGVGAGYLRGEAGEFGRRLRHGRLRRGRLRGLRHGARGGRSPRRPAAPGRGSGGPSRGRGWPVAARRRGGVPVRPGRRGGRSSGAGPRGGCGRRFRPGRAGRRRRLRALRAGRWCRRRCRTCGSH